MRQRIVVGLLALPVALIPIWLGGLWATGFMLLVALLAGGEFYRLMQIGGYQPTQVLGLLWLAALIAAYGAPEWIDLSLVLMVGLIAVLVDATARRQAPLHVWMATSMGAIYIGVMIGQAVALRLATQRAVVAAVGLDDHLEQRHRGLLCRRHMGPSQAVAAH